jgi:uncharacterized protein (TIGR04255 family)
MGDITYPKNFITKVLFRIDFSRIQSLENEPTEFKKAIQGSFPTLESVIRKGIIMQAGLVQSSAPQQFSQTVWQFTSADGKIHCNVLPESLVLESTVYKNYSAFSEVIKTVLDAFYATCGEVNIGRTGLRYINEIVIPEDENYLEWKGYISPSIVSILDFKPDDTTLKRSLNTAEYSVDPETTINLRTGIFNSTYPANLVRKEFVIDIDCYSNRSIKDEKSLLEEAKRYNEILTDTFESLIENGLRALLNKD